MMCSMILVQEAGQLLQSPRSPGGKRARLQCAVLEGAASEVDSTPRGLGLLSTESGFIEREPITRPGASVSLDPTFPLAPTEC